MGPFKNRLFNQQLTNQNSAMGEEGGSGEKKKKSGRANDRGAWKGRVDDAEADADENRQESHR